MFTPIESTDLVFKQFQPNSIHCYVLQLWSQAHSIIVCERSLIQNERALTEFSSANKISITMTFGIYACKSLKLIQAKHHDKPRHNQRVYYALRFFPLHDEPGHDSLGTCSLLCSFHKTIRETQQQNTIVYSQQHK